MAGFRRIMACLLALAAVGFVSGCGKKGALIPPEALAPAPVTDLAVAQKGEHFEVSWPTPSRQEGGARLTDLAGFLLFRRAVLPPGEDCEECPSAYQQLARIDLDYPQGARRVGNRFIYDDTDIFKGNTYQYKVRSFTEGGEQSRDSNKARRTAVIPAPPPILETHFSPSGVTLALQADPPKEGTITGYNIYRAEEGTPMPPSPLATVTKPIYEDTAVLIGTRYSYWATTLADVNGQVVESVPSSLASGEMEPRD